MNAAATPATKTANAYGLTLFRFEMKIGRSCRTCEQWHPSQDSAEQAAMAVLEDWREGKRGKVERVYPVSLADAVERGIIKPVA